MNLTNFIADNWDGCIRRNTEDHGTLIGLPYPYSVPNTGCFDEMYYWDTYFTNKGLLLSKRQEQAKNNVNNMLYLVKRFGFMPNGNRTTYLHNSQPPFLSEMVKDIYEFYADKEWLADAYDMLIREYEFWMTQRMTPIGLNAYSGNPMGEETIDFYAGIYEGRTGYKCTGDNRFNIAHHSLASAESGWDMNPRWGIDAYNYASVDLNSLLYGFEKNMEYFSTELGKNSEIWIERAEKRKKLMKKYLTNAEGIMTDYNFAKNHHSNILSAAILYPLFTKLADDNYADKVVQNIGRIKGEYGIFACEKSKQDEIYQWDYPNGWPCLQFIAIKSLDNYGYRELALDIAKKYTYVLEKNFEITGNLWEKYNMLDASAKTRQELNAENDLPVMMGWTAGTYIAAKKYIEYTI